MTSYLGYGDESSDESKQRVFAVASIFASRKEWAAFRRAWRARTNGITFHAADCESDRGLFSKRPHAENKALYKDLATLIGESGFVGCASAVSLPDFAEILAPTTIDDPYYLCFLSTVIGQASDASVCIPRGTIAFTFDRNPPVEFNASALYDGVVHRNNDPNAHYVEAMAEDLSFATRRTIGIQAADLLAYEAMKRMDNEYGPVRRPKRRSFEAIFKNRAIRIRLFNRSWCLNAKRFAMTTEYPKDDYMRWLHSQERRDDNLSNRLRFQAEKGALAELGGET